tara:strand:- start:1111 stop:1248 length:138 start_codon:yes stop_codon:yes gene_type:complete
MPVLELNEKYKGKILDLLINPQKIEKFKKKEISILLGTIVRNYVR